MLQTDGFDKEYTSSLDELSDKANHTIDMVRGGNRIQTFYFASNLSISAYQVFPYHRSFSIVL